MANLVKLVIYNYGVIYVWSFVHKYFNFTNKLTKTNLIALLWCMVFDGENL